MNPPNTLGYDIEANAALMRDAVFNLNRVVHYGRVLVLCSIDAYIVANIAHLMDTPHMIEVRHTLLLPNPFYSIQAFDHNTQQLLTSLHILTPIKDTSVSDEKSILCPEN